ncbi:alpha/beta fold hydrolase [Agrococcus beijingensis]|uniref:alpha/beta fold hydrolase n=1 Tax=Agrococcus beijingensis TaxID=3068634 RepID=UPI002741B65C|nr:alpha/beta hydrolase [Agrococcus sp. REN33]
MKRAWLVGALAAALMLSGCAANSPFDLADGQASLDCEGDGATTVVLLAGMGDDASTWRPLRDALGPNVRTCAWDYPGVGGSTGSAAPMTAGVAAASLDATLTAAGVDRPVMLVGHSIAGLTVRLFVGQHPDDVAGVVLFDPTVSSFAHRYDLKSFQPSWDGAGSAHEVDEITVWPDIPFEILRHDSAVYAEQGMWDAQVEVAWIVGQADFASLAPSGVVTEVPGAGHYVHRDQQQTAVDAVLRVLGQIE